MIGIKNLNLLDLFRGKLNRKNFILSLVFFSISFLILGWLFFTILSQEEVFSRLLFFLIALLIVFLLVLFFYIFFSCIVRRLHSLNLSGKILIPFFILSGILCFLCIFQIISPNYLILAFYILFFLILSFVRGDEDDNSNISVKNIFLTNNQKDLKEIKRDMSINFKIAGVFFLIVLCLVFLILYCLHINKQDGSLGLAFLGVLLIIFPALAFSLSSFLIFSLGALSNYLDYKKYVPNRQKDGKL